MREQSPEPPAKWTLYGLPLQKGLALGVGAPLYLPTYGSPIWFDPRLFAADEEEWHAIEYRMPTEPVEVIGIVRDLNDIPPVLAPYVRVVGWIVERAPEPPLPQVPVLLVAKLPALLPSEATVILDANAGVAYIEPNVALLARYQSQLLRVATHARYHLEGEHLPVTSWDGKRVQVGSVAADWGSVSESAASGAELVWLTADALPERVSEVAHALGGKPFWFYDPRSAQRDDAHWQRLLRMSAELNLTLFVGDLEALYDARDSLEVARESLRAEHVPIGALEMGLVLDAGDSLSLAEREFETLAPEPPYAVCWQVGRFTKKVVELLWKQQSLGRALGVRRALIMPDAQPETLAIGLGMEPHTLFFAPEQVADAKLRIALLSVAECREWLLQRLRRWNDATLAQQPQSWIAERT
ncbi:MAG: hypothetical protein N2651_02245 [Fimbriimonadales bacterium]|nr:hypothetical protein [Fimbriimonadales bacterium]